MCTSLASSIGNQIPGNPFGQSRAISDKQSVEAKDVPLGDGLAGTARTAILTRRERIRQAVEGAE